MRSELHRLVRDFRNYLSLQRQGLTLPGAPPASPEDREPFDERHARWRANRRERATSALRGGRPEPARQTAPARPAAPTRPEPSAQAPATPPQRSPQPTPAPTPTPGRSPAERTAQIDKPAAPAPPPSSGSSKEKLWLEIGSKPKSTFAAPAPEADDRAFDPDDSSMSNGQKLEALRTFLGDCERCGLCKSRTHLVFGQGSPNSQLMFIGESPGVAEDTAGQAMVGDAGDLLNKMIGAMGFKREDVYLTNVVKCRAIERDPSDEETQRCSSFIHQQIQAIQPAVIVLLGRFATQALLGAGKTRPGDWTKFGGIPVMPTFHPEFLLENPEAKRDAWTDLQAVMTFLNNPGSLND